MTYRSHFSGTFEAYLDHLRETTARQIEWTRQERPIDAGIATTYLFREEYQPVTDMTSAAGELARVPEKDETGGAAARNALQKASDALQQPLRTLAPERSADIAALAGRLTAAKPGAETVAAAADLTKALNRLRADPPEGWLPADKLARAIQAARDAHPAGIAIFSAGSLTREHLWPALEAAFAR
jgi:vacuolar-type H+-ATPase subunit I/STV1